MATRRPHTKKKITFYPFASFFSPTARDTIESKHHRHRHRHHRYQMDSSPPHKQQVEMEMAATFALPMSPPNKKFPLPVSPRHLIASGLRSSTGSALLLGYRRSSGSSHIFFPQRQIKASTRAELLDKIRTFNSADPIYFCVICELRRTSGEAVSCVTGTMRAALSRAASGSSPLEIPYHETCRDSYPVTVAILSAIKDIAFLPQTDDPYIPSNMAEWAAYTRLARFLTSSSSSAAAPVRSSGDVSNKCPLCTFYGWKDPVNESKITDKRGNACHPTCLRQLSDPLNVRLMQKLKWSHGHITRTRSQERDYPATSTSLVPARSNLPTNTG
jgi:hypothetical protein